MLQSVPDIYLMGGPNGAGKTTTALRIFPALGVTHFINADAIAQGLSPLDVSRVARAAGRLMLEQMEIRLSRGDDFALESTLASRSLAPFIERCKAAGYRFTLIYIWLDSANLAVERVARRVIAGGHDIPEATIRRRYERGRKNFFELYGPLADRTTAWNNSDLEPKPTRNFLIKPWIQISEVDGKSTATLSPQIQTLSENLQEAVADAIETHRRMGRSIVISRDGVVTRVRPSEIEPRALPHDAREARAK